MTTFLIPLASRMERFVDDSSEDLVADDIEKSYLSPRRREGDITLNDTRD